MVLACIKNPGKTPRTVVMHGLEGLDTALHADNVLAVHVPPVERAAYCHRDDKGRLVWSAS